MNEIKSKLQAIYLIIVFSLVGTTSIFSQQNYYVSLSGDNSDDGLSINTAWETIQHAMDNTPPNSIVNITSGAYNEKVSVNVSGSAAGSIIFKNYNDDVVVLDGTGLVSNIAMIEITNQNFITIEGIHITNNVMLDAQGISINGRCNDIHILKNEISNIHFSSDPNEVATANKNSQPLIVYGDSTTSNLGLLVDSNIIRDSRTGYSEGLAVNGNVERFSITNNQVYNISNIGIDIIGHEGTAPNSLLDQARSGSVLKNIVYNCKSPYATAAGIYVDGGKDLVIEGNIVYDCQWGIEIGCENVGTSTSGIVVRSNFIFKNEDAGLAMGGFDYPSGSGKVVDCQFINNTCYGNDATDVPSLGGVSGEINLTYTENCVIKSNVFYGTNSANIMLYQENVGSINLDLDYNNYYGVTEFEYNNLIFVGLSDFQSNTFQDSNSIEADPLLVDVLTDDYHITANSPGLDLGDTLFIALFRVDIDGQTRVLNHRIDMGADEYFDSSETHIRVNEDCIQVLYNPLTDKFFIEGDFSKYNMKVLNSSEMEIMNLPTLTSPIEVSLADIPSGLHFIKIRKNIVIDSLEIQKIIKQ